MTANWRVGRGILRQTLLRRRTGGRYRKVFECRVTGMGLVGLDLRVIRANDRFVEMFGRGAAELVGRSVLDLVVPDDRQQLATQLAHALAGNEVEVEVEVRARDAGGREQMLSARVAPLLDASGRTEELLLQVRDITQQARQAEDVRLIAQMARALLRAGDPDDARQTLCREVLELSEAVQVCLLEPRDDELVQTATAGEGSVHPPVRLPIGLGSKPSYVTEVFRTGTSRFLAEMAAPGTPAAASAEARPGLCEPVLADDRVLGVLCAVWDRPMTEPPDRVAALMPLVAAEAAVAIDRADLLRRLSEQAATDPLTELPNRRGWTAALARELAHARRDGTPLCLAMLDLDHFKVYNDTRGHAAGDALLVAVAGLWHAVAREVDVLARVGGDEFAMLLPGATLEAAAQVVSRLRRATPPDIAMSGGIALWDGTESGDELLRRADALLYREKAARRPPGLTVTPDLSVSVASEQATAR